jgi:hypothetical protein
LVLTTGLLVTEIYSAKKRRVKSESEVESFCIAG